MSSGGFWSGILTANQDTDTGATPAGIVRTVNVLLVNDTTDTVTAKIYIANGGAGSRQFRIEPDIKIPAGTPYRLSGEPVGPGEHVVINSSAAIPGRISGFEEAA